MEIPMKPSFLSLLGRAVALSGLFAALSLSAARADFVGGGTVFAVTDACAPVWTPGRVYPTHVRYAPSEDLGQPPSHVTLAFPTGTEHFSLWGPMTPSGTVFRRAAGRQTWNRFVFYSNEPMMRVVQRTVTRTLDPQEPATIENAREIVVRLRINNFSNIPGCAATIAAVLRSDSIIPPAEPELIFYNGNIWAVGNGPTQPTEFVLDRPVLMTRLQNYHWNYGQGHTPPGMIGLVRVAPDGATLGPWQTLGGIGQGGVQNAYWYADQEIVLAPGTYRVTDSNPETWSQNSLSGGAGFTWMWGFVLPE